MSNDNCAYPVNKCRVFSVNKPGYLTSKSFTLFKSAIVCTDEASYLFTSCYFNTMVMYKVIGNTIISYSLQTISIVNGQF